jgi:hypothetical protein
MGEQYSGEGKLSDVILMTARSCTVLEVTLGEMELLSH